MCFKVPSMRKHEEARFALVSHLIGLAPNRSYEETGFALVSRL